MKKIIKFFFMLTLLLPSVVLATERNIIPRFPEFVIEKESSQDFKVKECIAKASIEGEVAKTKLYAVLTNISDKELSNSVKFRILYSTGMSNILIKINGKEFKYDPENPRYSFSLKPAEDICFEMNANVSINYSIDAVRNALKRIEEAEKEGSVRNKPSMKKKGQELSESFMRLFKSNDRFGQRFHVGMLVSKWGLFPPAFEKLSLEITVPENYTIVSPVELAWNLTENKRNKTYRTTDVVIYDSAVFLPAAEKEEHLATMRILRSYKFKN